MYTKAAVPVLRSRDFTSYECLLGYKLYGNPTKINICTSLLFSQFRKEIIMEYIVVQSGEVLCNIMRETDTGYTQFKSILQLGR